MQNSSKTINPNQEVKTKLQNLLALTITSTDKVSLRSGENNDSIISFTNDENGKAAAIRFLNKLEVGELIHENQVRNAKDMIEHGTITPPSLFVRIATNNNNINIIFNHQSHYSHIVKRLDKAIESAKQDLNGKSENLEKAWNKDSPPSKAEEVVLCLHKKLVSSFPRMLTKRDFKVTYSATETPEYKFWATTNNKQNSDPEAIKSLVEELNRKLGNDGKAELIENDSTYGIGFSVTGKPEKLLEYLKNPAHLKLPQGSKPSYYR